MTKTFLPLNIYLNNISFPCPNDEEINWASKGSVKLNEFKLYSIVFIKLPSVIVDFSKLLKRLAKPMNKIINPKIINNPKIIAIIFISLILETI